MGEHAPVRERKRIPHILSGTLSAGSVVRLRKRRIGATICALHKNAQAGIISNQCHIFVQLVEAAKVEMSLIESFAGDYRRWSRIEQIVSPAFLIAALGGVASMFTPLLGG